MANNKQDIIEALNLSDSFTLAMDEEIRKDGLAGSYGCFGLDLNQLPNVEILQQRIAELSQCFPTTLASIQQQGRRFYWCKRETAPQLFFHHQCLDKNQSDISFQQSKIDQIINHKQERESITPIEFHLITSETKNTFFIRWIHPFCDARGADLILQFLCTDDDNQRLQIGTPETQPLANIQLSKYPWWKKIVLLIKAKRYIDSLDKLTSIQPFASNQSPQRLNYSVQRLTEEQTNQVIQQARKAVGLTGTSLYYIGCLMRALEKLNPNNKGDAYCAPYAFNLRKQRVLTPVTGNHISALFAQVPRDIINNRETLFTHLKQQNTEVIRQQLDYAFLPLMWAGSWLSLGEYGKILRLSNGTDNERSSFWFSDIGKVDFSHQSFPDAEINSVFNICQVSSPPGFAFLSCIYHQQLTLSYNFIEPLISSEQIEALHVLVLAELLDQSE